jgi:cell surface hyaluronidase
VGGGGGKKECWLVSRQEQWKGREGKGREGKGREGKGREGKGKGVG